MAFIYDNLVATIAAMTVVLILAAMQMRTMQQEVAQTSHYAMTQQTTQLSSWLQRDLAKIGKNRGPGGSAPYDVPFETTVPSNDSTAKWLTETLVFVRDSVKPSGSIVTVRTRYNVQKTGTDMINGEEKDIYRLEREQKMGTNPWEPTGGSVARLRYFDVDMLNKNAEPVDSAETVLESDPDTVRSVRIRFSVASPFQNDQLSVPASHANTVVAQYLPANPLQ